MESRHSKESVIARLMGLDELPPPEGSIQKTSRVLSENYLHRVASIGVGKKRSSHERHSVWTSLKEKRDSKDVSQVEKCLKVDKHLYRKRLDSSLGLSVNMKPQTSLAFQDSSEIFYYRNDYFEKNVLKRDSLFSKDLHDLQVRLALSRSEDMMVLKSPHTSVCRTVDNFSKSRRRTEFGYLKPLQKLKNGIATGSHENQLAGSFHETERAVLLPENEACSSNMQSSALKLIHGESKNSERCFSVPSSHSGVDKCLEFSGPDKWRGVEDKDVNKLGCDMEFIRRRSAAKKEAFATKSLSSSRSSNWKKRHSSFSFINESFSIEVKKHLSDRHLMQNVKEVGPGSRGNNLYELFVMQDHDSRWRDHKTGNGRHGLKDLELNRFSKQQIKYEAFLSKWHLRSDKSLNWARLKLRNHNSDEDDGSESRDMQLKSAASKSLPCLDSEDSPSYFNTKDNNSLQDIRTRKHDMKKKLDDCNMYKQNMILPQPWIRTVGYVSRAVDMVVDTQNEFAVKPSGKSEVEQLGSTSGILLEEDDDCSSRATDGSVQQELLIGFQEENSVLPNCYGKELDSLVILEEGCHPSPISVLELSFGEETTYSSEFLGRSMNDICDLRRQLENLQSETLETYSEGHGMTVSSDDESEEGLAGDSMVNNSLKNFRVEESMKFSYLVEVFTEASLHGRNLVEFSTWHSLDCPIGLLVFETIEKKYGDQMSWKRSERRLLFDRINVGLMEILLPYIGVPTSEKSVSRRFNTIRAQNMLEEDLWKLLVCQEKECSKNSAEKILGSELGKLDLGGEIDAIGREIERLLLDELLAEFF